MSHKRTSRVSIHIANERGATIADLLTTVMIASVVLGVASLSFPDLMNGLALKGAAREVYSDLNRARSSAVSTNQRHRFVVSGDRLYKLHSDRDSDGTEDTREAVTTLELGEAWGGVKFGSTTAITFAPDGSAVAAGEIVVANNEGETKTIVVSPAGHIRIQ